MSQLRDEREENGACVFCHCAEYFNVCLKWLWMICIRLQSAAQSARTQLSVWWVSEYRSLWQNFILFRLTDENLIYLDWEFIIYCYIPSHRMEWVKYKYSICAIERSNNSKKCNKNWLLRRWWCCVKTKNRRRKNCPRHSINTLLINEQETWEPPYGHKFIKYDEKTK